MHFFLFPSSFFLALTFIAAKVNIQIMTPHFVISITPSTSFYTLQFPEAANFSLEIIELRQKKKSLQLSLEAN